MAKREVELLLKKQRKLKKKKNKLQMSITWLSVFSIVMVLFIAGTFKSIAYQNSDEGILQSEIHFDKSSVYVNSKDATRVPRTSKNAAGEIVEVDDPMDGYWTIMLYGVDARNSYDIVKDANADTQIICTINKETFEVKLVSILRDTFLVTPSGRHNKLTDIYAGWGVMEALGTVNKCFDLECTDFVSVNWKSVGLAINCLDGVDVHLDSAEVNYINRGIEYVVANTGLPQSDALVNVGDGTYHLNGVQAVVHCGNRTTGGLDDINRARRQREVIFAAMEKAKTCSIDQLINFVNVVLPGIATNIDTETILSMVTNVSKYTISDSVRFPFHCIYQEDLRTAYVYCNTLISNITELHLLLYNDDQYVPSSGLQEVNDYILQYAAEHP